MLNVSQFWNAFVAPAPDWWWNSLILTLSLVDGKCDLYREAFHNDRGHRYYQSGPLWLCRYTGTRALSGNILEIYRSNRDLESQPIFFRPILFSPTFHNHCFLYSLGMLNPTCLATLSLFSFSSLSMPILLSLRMWASSRDALLRISQS